jgi:predicted ribosomally synthesized peptide with nif11-like leader
MSVENVKAFYKRIKEDEEFRTEMGQDETLKDLDIGKLITFARKHGYEFTEADIKKHKEEYRKPRLSEAELELIREDMAAFLSH